MIRDTISDDLVNIQLRQMGAASIKTTPGYINIAKFEIGDGVKVTYPMMIGKLYNEQQVVDIIDSDLKKFKAAYISSNFSTFLDLAKDILTVNKELESLFLHHNVEREDLEKIDNELKNLRSLLGQIGEESPVLK